MWSVIRKTLLIVASFYLATSVYAGQGYIEKNGVRMPINDTLVTYDRESTELKIYLFPSRLSAIEKREIAKKGSPFSILWKKSSPDTNKWKWYPYAMFRVRGKHGKVNDLDNIQGFYLMAYGIEEKNFTDNINGVFTRKDRPDVYKKRGSRVELKYSSMNKFTKVKWDLNIRSEVHR